MSPADSVSQAIAADISPDTLAPPTVLGEIHLEYPRTVLFGNNERIYVSDTKNGHIHVFAPRGKLESSFTLPGIKFPYLAGWRADSLIVFAPEGRRFHLVVDTLSVMSVTAAKTPENSLHYALASGSRFYLKAVTRDTTHFLWTFDRAGAPIHESVLHGSSWEHAGFLRQFNGKVVSLSGFYPWALNWSEDLSDGPDTLRWRGFDSPMLRRTYAFDQGQGRGPPLITSSAAFAGEFWFVLNQRAGWLRVDIYDTSGMLQHILVEASPEYLKEFYPIDLAAHLNLDGTYQLAIALVAPKPSVRVYKWTRPKQL